MWKETVTVQGPYNFDLVLERLSMDPLHLLDLHLRTAKIPMYVGNDPIVISVTGQGTTDEPSFLMEGTTEIHKHEALSRLKKIFHWHQPLEEVSSHFEGTDLKQIFSEHRGTPVVLDFDYYSCLVKSIVHQQLKLAFAHTLTERYVKTFGFQKEGAWFYPKPERAAALTVEDLRELQFSTRKAEYVIGLSQQIVDGKLDLESLAEKTDEEIMAELIKIRGIGKWTAENFLLFGVGRPNLFPKADIGIQNAIKILYRLPQKPTIEEMESYSKTWSPFLSYASLYLWRSIEKRSEKK